jgi:hypothetical protein
VGVNSFVFWLSGMPAARRLADVMRLACAVVIRGFTLAMKSTFFSSSV